MRETTALALKSSVSQSVSTLNKNIDDDDSELETLLNSTSERCQSCSIECTFAKKNSTMISCTIVKKKKKLN